MVQFAASQAANRLTARRNSSNRMKPTALNSLTVALVEFPLLLILHADFVTIGGGASVRSHVRVASGA